MKPKHPSISSGSNPFNQTPFCVGFASGAVFVLAILGIIGMWVFATTNATAVHDNAPRLSTSPSSKVAEQAAVAASAAAASAAAAAAASTAGTTTTPEKPRNVFLQQDFLEYLSSLDRVPRKIHLVFPDRRVVEDNELEMVRHGINAFIRYNPTWNVTIYEYADVDNVIRSAPMLSDEEKDLLLDRDGGAHIVEKSDLVRFILMYQEGGLYSDMDRVTNVPLDSIILPQTRLCLPTFVDENFMNDVICSPKGNKLYLEMIEESSKLRLTGGPDGTPIPRKGGWMRTSNFMELGPGMYNRIVGRNVFGINKDSGGDPVPIEHVPEARDLLLETTNGLIVTKKDEHCNGFFVVPFDGCKEVNQLSMYEKYGLNFWAVTVDRRWEED